MNKDLFFITQKDGHCNIDFSVLVTKITREEFNEVVRMTYYALKTLEENIINNEINNEVKPNE